MLIPIIITILAIITLILSFKLFKLKKEMKISNDALKGALQLRETMIKDYHLAIHDIIVKDEELNLREKKIEYLIEKNKSLTKENESVKYDLINLLTNQHK